MLQKIMNGNFGYAMAESFYDYSPYMYAMNNPILYVDPDGNFTTRAWSLGPMDVIIKGDSKSIAFDELQKSVSGELSLKMDENGRVTAEKVGDGELSKGASDLFNATRDINVTATIDASTNDFASNGDPLIGNQMGANVNTDGSVNAKQEINPVALKNMDAINNKPGQTTLHEVTEAYSVGKIAEVTGESIKPATMADGANPDSPYRQSHDNVVPQSGEVGVFNQNGTPIPNPSSGIAPSTKTIIYGTRPHGSKNKMKPFHIIKLKK